MSGIGTWCIGLFSQLGGMGWPEHSRLDHLLIFHATWGQPLASVTRINVTSDLCVTLSLLILLPFSTDLSKRNNLSLRHARSLSGNLDFNASLAWVTEYKHNQWSICPFLEILTLILTTVIKYSSFCTCLFASQVALHSCWRVSVLGRTSVLFITPFLSPLRNPFFPLLWRDEFLIHQNLFGSTFVLKMIQNSLCEKKLILKQSQDGFKYVLSRKHVLWASRAKEYEKSLQKHTNIYQNYPPPSAKVQPITPSSRNFLCETL